MASTAAQKVIAAGGLHDQLQGDNGVLYLVLKLIDSQDDSDSSTNVFVELFNNRLASYPLQDTVRKLREYCSQFQKQFGPLPRLDV